MKDYDQPAYLQKKGQDKGKQFEAKLDQAQRQSFEPAILKHKMPVKPILHAQKVLGQAKDPQGGGHQSFQVPFIKAEAKKAQAKEPKLPVQPLPNLKTSAHDKFAQKERAQDALKEVPFLKKAKKNQAQADQDDPDLAIQSRLFNDDLLAQPPAQAQPNEEPAQASQPYVYQPAFQNKPKPEPIQTVQESFFDDQLNIKQEVLPDPFNPVRHSAIDIRSIYKRMHKTNDSFLLFENEEG